MGESFELLGKVQLLLRKDGCVIELEELLNIPESEEEEIITLQNF